MDALQPLLEDAWLCYVGSTLTRASMSSLRDIDGYVVKWGNSTLTLLERSLQSALHSGAFMDAWTQGKFDITKTKPCNQCQCPQTQEHVLVCPKYRDLRDQVFLTEELDQLPRHLALHLLCQRSPWIDDLRAYFLGLPGNTDDFVSAPSGTGTGTQHLFTDGSHTADGRFETRRAAWGLHNATSHRPIGSGHLVGLPQTIVLGLRLPQSLPPSDGLCFGGVKVHIWLDALEIQKGLQQRLDGHCTSLDEHNTDLWFIVDALLAWWNVNLRLWNGLPHTMASLIHWRFVAVMIGHAASHSCWRFRRSGIRDIYQSAAEATQALLCHVSARQSFQTHFREHSDRIQWWGKWEPFVQFSWYSFNWHGSCTLCTKLRIPSWVSAIFVRVGFELMTSTIKLLFLLVFLGSLLVFWRLLRCSSLSEIPRLGTGLWWIAVLCSKGLIYRESFKRCFRIFAGTGAKALQCARISTDQHLEWPFLWHLLKASARHSGNCTWKPVHFHSPEANPALQRFGQTSGLNLQTCLLRHCRRCRHCRAQGTWKGVRAKHSEIDPILPIFTPPLHGPNMWIIPYIYHGFWLAVRIQRGFGAEMWPTS